MGEYIESNDLKKQILMGSNNVSLRIESADFIKGIMITLMVTFHLPLNGLICEAYPYVYTFHMPTFLVLSGFFLKVEKDNKLFYRGLSNIAIPYILFQSIYLFVIGLLPQYIPTANHIENFSFKTIVYGLLFKPYGTYWYLHTLLIYAICLKICYEIAKKELLHAIVLSISCFAILDYFLEGFEFTYAIYLIAGSICKLIYIKNKDIKISSITSIIPIFIIFVCSSNPSRYQLTTGFVITLLMISFCSALYKYIPQRTSIIINYIGRNSLCIVLFSSYYNVVIKFIAPYFSFDKTGFSIALIGTTLVTLFCLLTKNILKKLQFNYV